MTVRSVKILLLEKTTSEDTSSLNMFSKCTVCGEKFESDKILQKHCLIKDSVRVKNFIVPYAIYVLRYMCDVLYVKLYHDLNV